MHNALFHSYKFPTREIPGHKPSHSRSAFLHCPDNSCAWTTQRLLKASLLSQPPQALRATELQLLRAPCSLLPQEPARALLTRQQDRGREEEWGCRQGTAPPRSAPPVRPPMGGSQDARRAPRKSSGLDRPRLERAGFEASLGRP